MDSRVLKLEHVHYDVANFGGSSGKVVVLNTGAIITPEAEAMLQALHSRSIGGIDAHLKVLAERGPEKFMSGFYVGYGHKSIGDCGTGTLFIEGVSMLVAKAIQDWMLYAGQEASTRYIPFETQHFFNPLETDEAKSVLEGWRSFYMSSQEPLRASLRERFPIGGSEKPEIYEKAINARSFDILRGFLPAGASTNLAWHTNLRQAADKLMYLRHHPLDEVRAVAEAIDVALKQAFPNSFGHKRYEATEEYNHWWMNKGYFFSPPAGYPEFEFSFDGVDHRLLREYRDVMQKRPEKTELPKQVGECGTARVEFLLDFGSYRDVQRQRAVIQRMPLLTSTFGFHPWYLRELPSGLAREALALLERQIATIDALGAEPEVVQYYLPMGFQVPNRISGDLPALVYLVELRSSPTVHPTLQERAAQMGQKLIERYGDDGLVVYIDRGTGRFSVKRGEHDIVRKD